MEDKYGKKKAFLLALPTKQKQLHLCLLNESSFRKSSVDRLYMQVNILEINTFSCEYI